MFDCVGSVVYISIAAISWGEGTLQILGISIFFMYLECMTARTTNTIPVIVCGSVHEESPGSLKLRTPRPPFNTGLNAAGPALPASALYTNTTVAYYCVRLPYAYI